MAQAAIANISLEIRLIDFLPDMNVVEAGILRKI